MHLPDCVAPTKYEEDLVSFDIISTEFVSGTEHYKTFGILAKVGEETLTIEDISDEYCLVECLCRRLREGQPPLYQLRDIVEDYLIDWPFIRDDELKKAQFCDMMGKKYSE
ncbi:MAG TPA: hypothetical protein H9662_08835 [Firmicutes bacterium]|nr:hypothetical protein [Bacillota bacterium]